MSESTLGQLAITTQVKIPLAELHFEFVRSSGPGGQHVNRSATQVELTFDLAGSPSLDDVQKRACERRSNPTWTRMACCTWPRRFPAASYRIART